MTIEQLQAIHEIAACGTVSRAADARCVSQPALSMQLKQLESELGVQLFERSNKGLRPTGIGQQFIDRARLVLGEIRGMAELAASQQGLLTGNLSLACSDTVAQYLLLPVLRRFAARHPGIQLRILNKTGREIRELVAGARVDAGFLNQNLVSAGMSARHAWTMQEVALTVDPAAAMRATPAALGLGELAKRRLLILEPGTGMRQRLDHACAQAGLVLDQYLELGSVEVQKAFAMAGQGTAIVPDCSLDPDTRLASVIRPIPGLPAVDVVLAWRQRQLPSPALRAFIEVLASTTNQA